MQSNWVVNNFFEFLRDPEIGDPLDHLGVEWREISEFSEHQLYGLGLGFQTNGLNNKYIYIYTIYIILGFRV